MTPPEELLSAYLDGEVSPEERALVEEQLEQSSEWRAVLTEVRETRALVCALPERDAPDGFWSGVLDDAPAPVSLDSRRTRRGRVAGWIAGAAAAAAIAAVVFVPRESEVKPRVATLVTSHAARSSVSEEPVSQLAPVATPVRFRR